MKTLLVISLLTLGLASCDTANCAQYKDEASCVAVTSCHWNKNETACKS